MTFSTIFSRNQNRKKLNNLQAYEQAVDEGD